MRRSGWQRNVHFTRQSNDPARRVVRHFLLHGDGHAAQINAKFLRPDSHCRAHARGERRGNKVRRRKRFAFAFIVGRRIGGDFRLRRPMGRVAMQIASVFDGNFDHKFCHRLTQIFTDSELGNLCFICVHPRRPVFPEFSLRTLQPNPAVCSKHLKNEKENQRKRLNKGSAAQSAHSSRRLRHSWPHHRQMPGACGWEHRRIPLQLSAR